MRLFWQRFRRDGDNGADRSSESLLRAAQQDEPLVSMSVRSSQTPEDNLANESPCRSPVGSCAVRSVPEHSETDSETGHSTHRNNSPDIQNPHSVEVVVESGGGIEEAVSPCSSANSPKRTRSRSDSLPSCLICLEVMDIADKANVVALGCRCKGAAAYRHKECLDRWLIVKGNTTCDVCGEAMISVQLPPPPPVPGYVVFPELEHSFEVQWETFWRYLWHNAVAVIVYCLVLALLMDIKIYVAALIAAMVISLVILRYILSVAANTFAQRTVLSFQAPETS
jgi:hypothetical protein